MRDAAALVEHWYETMPAGDGITLIRERYVADWLRCNIWHVTGRERDLLIDAGMGLRPLKVEMPRLAERPAVAVASHCHFDHMGGLHQFDDRRGHPAEAHIYAEPTLDNTAAGPWIRAETFLASPYPGFRHEDFIVRPAPLTGHLDEGDVLDLGDRVFQVFHLPGHSPGSIALFETSTGILFAGDVVYDGALFDTVYHSDREIYRQSLSRLMELPVRCVHAGHWPSFGRERMRAIIADYLAGGRRLADPTTYINAATAEG